MRKDLKLQHNTKMLAMQLKAILDSNIMPIVEVLEAQSERVAVGLPMAQSDVYDKMARWAHSMALQGYTVADICFGLTAYADGIIKGATNCSNT